MATALRHLRAVTMPCTHAHLFGEDFGRMWCVTCDDCGVIIEYDIRVLLKALSIN